MFSVTLSLLLGCFKEPILKLIIWGQCSNIPTLNYEKNMNEKEEEYVCIYHLCYSIALRSRLHNP